MTIRVAGDDKGSTPDHYVTVGHQKNGTSTLVIGGKGPKADADFLQRTDKDNDRMVTDLSADALPPGLRYSP